MFTLVKLLFKFGKEECEKNELCLTRFLLEFVHIVFRPCDVVDLCGLRNAGRHADCEGCGGRIRTVRDERIGCHGDHIWQKNNVQSRPGRVPN